MLQLGGYMRYLLIVKDLSSTTIGIREPCCLYRAYNTYDE